MKLLPASTADVNYVVDIGPALVPDLGWMWGKRVGIAAVNARDAYRGAMAACFGPGVGCAALNPVVYKIDPAGELIAVVD
jgi:hypothetical protein